MSNIFLLAFGRRRVLSGFYCVIAKWRPMAGPRNEEVYTVEILRDTDTGVAVSERWAKEGCGTHREDGPAMIIRDSETGAVRSEFWARNNAFDRANGPAIIKRDPKTGIVTEERWMRNNNYHREDGPAIIKRNRRTGKIHFTQWYRDDVKITPTRPKRRSSSPQRPSGSPKTT
jgi:hypothetical protein